MQVAHRFSAHMLYLTGYQKKKLTSKRVALVRLALLTDTNCILVKEIVLFTPRENNLFKKLLMIFKHGKRQLKRFIRKKR